MINLPKCPKCSSEYTYKDNGFLICPECAHEWNEEVESQNAEDKKIVKDANGNILNDGDSVAILKDLKVHQP
jgi:protein PhnA